MHFMAHSLALELRRELEGTGAEISYVGSEKYHENIKSWSDTCEKEAVRFLTSTNLATMSIDAY